jgi:hypothetical protein
MSDITPILTSLPNMEPWERLQREMFQRIVRALEIPPEIAYRLEPSRGLTIANILTALEELLAEYGIEVTDD